MAGFGDSSDKGSHKEGGTKKGAQRRGVTKEGAQGGKKRGSREAVALVSTGNQLAAHKPTRLVA